MSEVRRLGGPYSRFLDSPARSPVFILTEVSRLQLAIRKFQFILLENLTLKQKLMIQAWSHVVSKIRTRNSNLYPSNNSSVIIGSRYRYRGEKRTCTTVHLDYKRVGKSEIKFARVLATSYHIMYKFQGMTQQSMIN
jgi:hypothetical protein